ncbi:MAG: hypothetical protein OXN89_01400 [Bryobacterales bacterium]|nr:hypothetical protein [Bryobacterales bacterium]
MDFGHVLSMIGILIALWSIPDERIPRLLRKFSQDESVLTGTVVCALLVLAGFWYGPAPVEVDSTTMPVVEESSSETLTRNRNFVFGKTNDHCQGPQDVRWRVPADEGWTIEPDSVEAYALVQSEKSSFYGVTLEPDGGAFQINGRIVNNGNCIRLFGKVIAKDARGSLRVRATYRETRIELP